MTLNTFEKKLNNDKKVELHFSFKIPNIRERGYEVYLFERETKYIVSYKNGEKEFETDNIAHIYFIYRKMFLYNKEKNNKRYLSREQRRFCNWKK